jgi:hypothetical protein
MRIENILILSVAGVLGYANVKQKVFPGCKCDPGVGFAAGEFPGVIDQVFQSQVQQVGVAFPHHARLDGYFYIKVAAMQYKLSSLSVPYPQLYRSTTATPNEPQKRLNKTR